MVLFIIEILLLCHAFQKVCKEDTIQCINKWLVQTGTTASLPQSAVKPLLEIYYKLNIYCIAEPQKKKIALSNTPLGSYLTVKITK